MRKRSTHCAVTCSPQFTVMVCYPAAGQVYINISCWVYSKVFYQTCTASPALCSPPLSVWSTLKEETTCCRFTHLQSQHHSTPRLHVFTCWTVFWSSWQAGRKMQTEAYREVSSLLSWQKQPLRCSAVLPQSPTGPLRLTASRTTLTFFLSVVANL